MSILKEALKENIARQPIFHRLKNELIAAMNGGVLAPGDKIPSESFLAKKYSIGRSSVRLALGELETEGRIFKRPGKGTYVKDYLTENSNSPSFPSLTIGTDVQFTLSIYDDWYSSKLLCGIEKVCNEHQCRLSFVRNSSFKNIRKGFIDGAIIMGAQENDYPLYECWEEKGLYPVLINRITELEHIAYFSVNYVLESEKAIDYLLDAGHRRIGIVASENINSFTNRIRYNGFVKAFQKRGLEPANSLCLVKEKLDDEYYSNEISSYLRNNDITAIYLLNGCFAIPLFNSFRRLGIKPPDDLAIMCFDDISFAYSIFGYPFSMVKMPLEKMGSDAAEYLLEKFKNGRSCPVAKKLYQAELKHFGGKGEA